MYAPSCDDEITTIERYVSEQLDAIRASAIGLTEEQARMRPCRSALSIGGLIKHATYVMRGTTDRLTVGPIRIACWTTPRSRRTSRASPSPKTRRLQAHLSEFDAVRVEYVAAISATDPAARTVVSPPLGTASSTAGPPSLVTASSIRSRSSPATPAMRTSCASRSTGWPCPAIVLSEAGAPANDFFQPFVAAPGTVGAR